MPEILLHYIWHQRLWQGFEQVTTDGRSVEIVAVGRHNLGAGPDFTNVHLRIDGKDYYGSVEMHVCSSDWYRHHHHTDPAYDHIILHVVRQADKIVYNSHGEPLPQCVLRYPDNEDYLSSLLHQAHEMDGFQTVLRCYRQLAKSPELLEEDWKKLLLIHRLGCKRDSIQRLLQITEEDWEVAFYISLARNFGFHYNSSAFEILALHTPLRYLRKHRDSLFQLTAVLLGQSGLLTDNSATDEEHRNLLNEYRFLQHKFDLHPIDKALWKRGFNRPQNNPELRIRQFAELLHHNEFVFSQCLCANSVDNLRNIFFFATEGTPQLGKASVDLLLINTVIPYRYAYNLWRNDEKKAEEALELYALLPAEGNSIVRQWKLLGQKVATAADSQALIHLYQNYCQPQNCLNCGVGYQVFLDENKLF